MACGSSRQEVARLEAGVAERLADALARHAVQVDAAACGGEAVEALRQEAGYRAGEHVAGAGAGEGGIGEGADGGAAIRSWRRRCGRP